MNAFPSGWKYTTWCKCFLYSTLDEMLPSGILQFLYLCRKKNFLVFSSRLPSCVFSSLLSWKDIPASVAQQGDCQENHPRYSHQLSLWPYSHQLSGRTVTEVIQAIPPPFCRPAKLSWGQTCYLYSSITAQWMPARPPTHYTLPHSKFHYLHWELTSPELNCPVSNLNLNWNIRC